MSSIITILASPREAFEQIKSTPRWVAALRTVVFGMATLAWIKTCFDKGSFSFDVVLFVTLFIGLLIVICCVWVFLSAFLYLSLVAITATQGLRFKPVFSVVSHSGVIFLLGEIANFLLVRTNLISQDLFPVPNRFPLGLDLFLIGKQVSPVLAAIFSSVNPFIVWYLSVVFLGITIVTDVRRSDAAVATALTWLAGMCVIAIAISIIGGTRVGIRLG